jgi:hypothetical protein
MTQEEECVMGTWLEKFLLYDNVTSGFNDSEAVRGWLSASLVDGILTVTYKPSDDSEFEAATERYRVQRLGDS